MEKHNVWITKQEALEMTKWKERTLERYLQKGFIARDQRSEPGLRPVTIVPLADVQKMLATKQQETERAKTPVVIKTVQRKPTRDITRHVSANGALPAMSPPLALSAASPPPSIPIEKKIFLTLDEAMEYSGLSRTYLLKAMKEERTLPYKFDGGYKIKRIHLEEHE